MIFSKFERCEAFLELVGYELYPTATNDVCDFFLDAVDNFKPDDFPEDADIREELSLYVADYVAKSNFSDANKAYFSTDAPDEPFVDHGEAVSVQDIIMAHLFAIVRDIISVELDL